MLATHYLEEAEELYERIVIIDHSNVIACETTSSLLARFDRKKTRRGRDRGFVSGADCA